MSKNYSIDKTTGTLIFTGKPKLLNKDRIKYKDKERFTSAVIPNSVSSIGAEAFAAAHSLASVHIPNSVAFIGHLAFCRCKTLASIHIQNSVKTIETFAFEDCTSLASIHIPNSVTTIDGSAFWNCSRLHKAYLSTNSKTIFHDEKPPFSPQTLLFRPQLKPVTALQKKSACSASKATYSVFL